MRVEIEREFVRANERAFLRRLLADDFVQRPMEQMRDGVMALDGRAAFGIDGEQNFATDGRGIVFVNSAFCLLPSAFQKVQPGVAALLRVSDPPEIGRRVPTRRCRRVGRPFPRSTRWCRG